MAVRFDASGDDLRRTANLPTITAFTIMGWFQIVVDRNAFSCFMAFGSNAGGGAYYALQTPADGTTLALWNNSSSVSGTGLSTGTWYHLAFTCAGTGAGQLLAYLNGVLDITHSGNAGPSAGRIEIGNDLDSEFLNGRAAAIKIYSAVLTAAEIAQEMRQILPLRTANLNGYYPLFSTDDDEIDFSGAGNNWTVTGTLATEDGPPIPWGAGRRRFLYSPAAAAASGYLLVAN